MCFPRGEFRVGQRDVLLGELEGTPFYIGGQQYEAWKHTQLADRRGARLRLRVLARGAARGQVSYPVAGVRSRGAGVAGGVFRDARAGGRSVGQDVIHRSRCEGAGPWRFHNQASPGGAMPGAITPGSCSCGHRGPQHTAFPSIVMPQVCEPPPEMLRNLSPPGNSRRVTG